MSEGANFFPGSELCTERTKSDEARVSEIRSKAGNNAAVEGTTAGFAKPQKSVRGQETY